MGLGNVGLLVAALSAADVNAEEPGEQVEEAELGYVRELGVLLERVEDADVAGLTSRAGEFSDLDGEVLRGNGFLLHAGASFSVGGGYEDVNQVVDLDQGLLLFPQRWREGALHGFETYAPFDLQGVDAEGGVVLRNREIIVDVDDVCLSVDIYRDVYVDMDEQTYFVLPGELSESSKYMIECSEVDDLVVRTVDELVEVEAEPVEEPVEEPVVVEEDEEGGRDWNVSVWGGGGYTREALDGYSLYNQPSLRLGAMGGFEHLQAGLSVNTVFGDRTHVDRFGGFLFYEWGDGQLSMGPTLGAGATFEPETVLGTTWSVEAGLLGDLDIGDNGLSLVAWANVGVDRDRPELGFVYDAVQARFDGGVGLKWGKSLGGGSGAVEMDGYVEELPVEEPAKDVDPVVDAEFMRLSEEARGAAKRKKGNWAKKAARDCDGIAELDLNVVDASPTDLYDAGLACTRAYEAYGDVAAELESLEMALSSGASDVENLVDHRANVNSVYAGPLDLVGSELALPKGVLMPFDPCQRAAIEFAQREIEKDGSCERCYLPNGMQFVLSGPEGVEILEYSVEQE